MSNTRGFFSLAIIIFSAFIFSSCFGGGGGDGGGSSSVAPPTPPVNPTPPPAPPITPSGSTATLTEGLPESFASDVQQIESLPQEAAFQSASAAAASMTPRSGSVTQSSNGDGVTADKVNVEISGGIVKALKNSQALGSAALSQTGGKTQTLFDVDVSGGDVSRVLYLHATSLSNNYEKFAAWGLWVENEGGSFTVGAFADSNSYFPQNQLRSLIGTARYDGTATAIYSKSGSDAEFEVLDVAGFTLTAEFGDANALGTISGEVSAAMGNREITLTLGSANIGSSNSGFFTGTTSGTLDSGGSSSTLAGSWGGQFLQNPNGGSGDYPSGLIGTFGGANSDGKESVIGSFQTITPTTVASSVQTRKLLVGGFSDKDNYICSRLCSSNGDPQWALAEHLFVESLDELLVSRPAWSYMHSSNFQKFLEGPFTFDGISEGRDVLHFSQTLVSRIENNGADEVVIQSSVGSGTLQTTIGVVDSPQKRRQPAPYSTSDVYADHMVYGDWLYTDPDGNTSFGVFAAGDRTFTTQTNSDFELLTGTATYSGRADGFYTSPDVTGVVDFTGTSALTADFGTESELGTITGTISSSGIVENQTLQWNLGGATIDSQAEFSGVTSASIDGVSYSGSWGGAFYTTGETPDPAGSVAGVFGSSSANGQYGVVGSFGAYKQ